MSKALFISVKPEFVEKIFNGTKTIELRKSIPGVKKEDMIIIYSTSPVMAIIGICKVKEILSMTPTNLWKEYSEKLGIDRQRYFDYYKGKNVAVGIVLKERQKFPDPIALSNFRRKFASFQPPQTFRYIDQKYFETSFLK